MEQRERERKRARERQREAERGTDKHRKMGDTILIVKADCMQA